MPRTKLTDVEAEAALNLALGDRLRAARLARGLTLDELASAVRVSYQACQKYELGRSAVSFPRLVALAAALNMSVPDLVTFGDPPGAAPPAPDRAVRDITRAFQALGDREQGLLLHIARELRRPDAG